MEQQEVHIIVQDEIAHLKELIDLHDKMTQLAIDKAETAMNERLAGMNEFRAQQADTIAKFATREAMIASLDKIELLFKNVNGELDTLKEWKSYMQGKFSIMLIIWPLILSIVVFILNHVFK